MSKLIPIVALLCSLLGFSNFTVASPTVEVETTLGSFVIELNSQAAPITVANFLRYVEDGSYKGSIFHRVIPDFMAQGGGFNSEMGRLPTYPPIKNEASNGLLNNQATIAMARTNNPDSASRQFFINYSDNSNLDYRRGSDGYAVFGTVTSGFSVIQEMATKPTARYKQMANVPKTPIVIIDIKIK
ncbi:MAG: peptidylprolyl isomerase [Aliivibrio sp.]|uniref:peptidylprolyl isomerase n=1 Tax=Aliivibrio sp. TaxID=1872443 RepID=UPI001A54F303|nr:peptidylprolyl isomerase [Aliivibrio sp.]